MEDYPYAVNDNGNWIYKFQGMEVTRCCFAYDFRILLWRMDTSPRKDVTAEVVIVTDYDLTIDGKTHHLRSPDEEDPTALGVAIGLFRKTVLSVTADSVGRLEMQLTDGTMLTVEPSEEYEAWNIYGPR